MANDKSYGSYKAAERSIKNIYVHFGNLCSHLFAFPSPFMFNVFFYIYIFLFSLKAFINVNITFYAQ